jgi:putative NADH-flavin reductase
MRIVVFGATGGVGALVVDEALRRGHQVVAVARDPGGTLVAPAGVAGGATIGVPGAVGGAGGVGVGLTIVRGDARDLAVAGEALTGADALISAISGAKEDPTRLESAARTILAAAQGAGVRRVIFTGAYGPVARKPYVVASIVRRVFAVQFADGMRADSLVAASDLAWTILRPTRLMAKPSRGPVQLTSDLLVHGPWSTSRAAVATTLTDLAESNHHVGQVLNQTGG